MVLYTVIDVLRRCGKIDMLRLSLMVSLLLDDRTVCLLERNRDEISFINLRILNRDMMANMNKRFYNTLPLFVNALAMLLDANCLRIENGAIMMKAEVAGEVFAGMGDIDSIMASRIHKVIPKMLQICNDNVSTKRIIQTLNIEI